MVSLTCQDSAGHRNISRECFMYTLPGPSLRNSNSPSPNWAQGIYTFNTLPKKSLLSGGVEKPMAWVLR
jgi:hypothetical protein